MAYYRIKFKKIPYFILSNYSTSLASRRRLAVDLGAAARRPKSVTLLSILRGRQRSRLEYENNAPRIQPVTRADQYARAAHRAIPKNTDHPLLLSSYEAQQGMGRRRKSRVEKIPHRTRPKQPNPPIRSRYIVRISRPERIPLVSAPPHDGSATFSTWSAPAVSAEVFAALLEAPAGAPAK